MHLTPDHLLLAYAQGIFPMAERRDDDAVHWVDPRLRGIFPLDAFHISRSLARRLRRWPHRVTVNTAFTEVVNACADRPETWINATILDLYTQLHLRKQAHSLEIWEENALVGGVYGVVLGSAFFGESMFSHRTDASKVALAYLTHRLRAGGFTLFDTQFLTPHLASLGAVEITRADYHQRLATALTQTASLTPPGYSSPVSLSSAAGASIPGTSQFSTQTS
ncbi:MAG: leucyl/phenylalanyl-tRNA--protein transferase [Paracoccaceae bacterium]